MELLFIPVPDTEMYFQLDRFWKCTNFKKSVWLKSHKS